MAELGETAARSGKFDLAYTLAESITEPGWHIEALARLAEEAASAGNVDKARAIIVHAEILTLAMTRPKDITESMIRLVEAAAVTGDCGRAEHIAQAITDPDGKAEALATLAMADRARTQLLLAQAFRSGSWTAPLPAVAVVDPNALPVMAAVFTEAVLPPADGDLNESPDDALPQYDDNTEWTFSYIVG